MIGLVSLSTTLATNALVEGQGGRVALVMIGFGEDDLTRDGLAEALGGDPVIFVPGGHNVHGKETPLDLAPLEAVTRRTQARMSAAFAVAGYFAVRNPAHEIAARDLIQRTETGTSGHLQPRTVVAAGRTAPGADDAAQCPACRHDRPADRCNARRICPVGRGSTRR